MGHQYLTGAAKAISNPPQSKPLDERQVQNNAGGYVYALDDWKRLDRWLILGSASGTYYVSESKLTEQNIDALKNCVTEDGIRTVNRIVEISDSGRAPKNDPALFALAYAASKGDNVTRAYALANLDKVARIGTHLFHFMDFAKKLRGTGRGLRSAISNWYEAKEPTRLAEQVVKYQQRDGWSHRDLLRLAHPKFKGAHQRIAKWVVKGEITKTTPDYILGHVKLQTETSPKKAAKLILDYGLTRESVPTNLLTEPVVWEALLQDMPITALIRNLGNLSKNGVLVPLSDATKLVVNRLSDTNLLKKGRVHPIQVLIATKTYASGHGLRGSGTWNTVPQIVDALDEAYYDCFQNIVPTGKNFYLGLDISGSMWSGDINGIPDFTPAVATAALAMVTVRSEQNYYVAGFTAASGGYGGQWGGGNSSLTPISLSPRQRLDNVLETTQALQEKMGGTDCALPILDATKKGYNVDVFTIYTDNETWAGTTHPTKALKDYRQKTGINAKLVVVGMTATNFTIADPNDPNMLDVVGFDANTPAIISSFAGE